MTRLKMSWRDPVMLVIVAVSGAAVIIMNIFLPGFVI